MSSPSHHRPCPQCGAASPLQTTHGLCPACLARHSLGNLIGPSTDTANAGSNELEGNEFGPYTLLEEIGRGGMGVVYKARQPGLDRLIALKTLVGGRFASRQARERFQLEANAAASLHHPNILAVHDYGVHEGQPFLTMNLVVGKSLAETVPAVRPSITDAAQMVRQICHAVHHAHQRGILHRDLKPSNILVDDSGKPYVTDFGLARFIDADSSLTLTGQAIGSPGFLPPEQADPTLGQATVASDVYSLGALLFYLLTGRPPFQGASGSAVLRKVLDEDPPKPRTLHSQIPRDLETICLKCLEKAPERRYATARELSDDLERYIQGRAVSARPLSLPNRGWRWCRRRPLVAALLSAVLLSTIGGAIGIAWQWRHALSAREDAERQNYNFRVSVAFRYIQEGRNDLAKDHLFACPERFRDLEWGHLLKLCHPEVWTVRGPQADYSRSSLQFNPNGSLIASRAGNSLVIRDVRSGTPVFQSSGVTSFAFHPRADARTAVMAQGDTLRLVATGTWRRIREETLNESTVQHVQFDLEGDRMLVVRSGGTARVWDYDSWTVSATIRDPSIRSATFTKHGESILTRGRNYDNQLRWLVHAPNDPVILWNARPGERLRTWQAPDDDPFAIYPDPSGSKRITVDRSKRILLWRSETESVELGKLRGPIDDQIRAAFSPDGRFVATTGLQGSASIWDVSSGAELYGFPGNVLRVGFSPDSRRIVTHFDDATIGVWTCDTLTHRLAADVAQKLKGHRRLAVVQAIDPAGNVMATQDGWGVLKLWKLDRPDMPVHPYDFQKRLAIFPDERWMATINYLGVSRIDLASRKPAKQWRGHINGMHSTLAVHPNGSQLATAADGMVRIFDSASGTMVTHLNGHRRRISDLDFSADGAWLATGSRDQTVRLWNVGDFKSVRQWCARS